MSRSRGVAPVLSTILMVALVIVLASIIAVFVLDLGERLNDGDKQRVFSDATVELGAEYRSWSGGGTQTNPDVDHINLLYRSGPVFESDEIGSIVIRWNGDDGEGGTLRFVNPSRFNSKADQQYHDGDVGRKCTGDIYAGDVLEFQIVHNRYQSGGETDPGDTNPVTGEPFGVRYVESGWNGITVNGEPFFYVSGRYPVEFSGDRPMEPGDDIEILFLDDEEEILLAKSTGTAQVFRGTPSETANDVSC